MPTPRVASILLLTTALAAPARAQGYGQAYGPPGSGPCGGFVTHLWVPQPGGYGGGSITIGGGSTSGGGGNSGGGGSHSATPVGGDGSSGGSSGGGGGGDGAALLVLLVVAAAALPVVLYAVDEDARPDVMQCWATPEERLSFYGGTASEAGLAPFLAARGLLHWYMVGIEGGVEGTPLGSFDIHGSFLARIPPKQHVEFALGFGGRRLYTRLGAQSWFEVSLPQRYAPFRTSALEPGVSFDLRPAFLFDPNGVWDVRLDAAIVFPLGPWASIDIGGRAYTFQGGVQGGALLGLQISL